MLGSKRKGIYLFQFTNQAEFGNELCHLSGGYQSGGTELKQLSRERPVRCQGNESLTGAKQWFYKNKCWFFFLKHFRETNWWRVKSTCCLHLPFAWLEASHRTGSMDLQNQGISRLFSKAGVTSGWIREGWDSHWLPDSLLRAISLFTSCFVYLFIFSPLWSETSGSQSPWEKTNSGMGL